MSRLGLISLLSVLALVACQSESTAPTPSPQAPASTATEAASPLLVYSGRNEKLIGPILQRFTSETGIEVRARYGETAEMAATLLEEGKNTPADVFIAQDVAALGAVAKRGMFRKLPNDLLQRVPARFAASGGEWIGISGRARSVVYNTKRMKPSDLPKSLEEIANPRYRGRLGVAPTNGSFQAHMAVYQSLNGVAALRDLLQKIVANEPRRYPNNKAIVDATIAGEIDLGLVNHYYLWQAKRTDSEAPAENWFMPEGNASSFINTAGAGVLSDNSNAVRLVEFLLSDDGQRYFANETHEYPLVESVKPPVDLTPLEQLKTPAVDFGRISDTLPSTLDIIQKSGLVQ